MRRSSAPTLNDVAREAGVSAMTVSVVVNGTGSNTRVSEDTRRRIHAAATRLCYRPNAYARGLSRRRMDTIGVVAVVDGNEVNLYFLEILNGVLEAAAERGQNTIVFSVKGWQPEHLNVTQFCDGRADGMIFIAPNLTPEFAEALQQRHLPFVTIHHGSELPNTVNFDVENERGAYTMVRHLIDQGHRRILYLSGDADGYDVRQRLAGYRRAVEEAGLPFDESLVFPGSYSSNSGRQRMTQILAQNLFGPFPTAIFCGNDATALGVMEVLTENGIRVPEDVSLAGFDDTLTAQIITPQLTTMRQPFRHMGRRSVEVLISQINASRGDSPANDFQRLEQEEGAPAGSAYPVQKTPDIDVFEVELIIRGSVGRPPLHPFIPTSGK
ncbi:MAG: LacI family DNA-binding transcriptional regulator [Armatimonadota bacterium]